MKRVKVSAGGPLAAFDLLKAVESRRAGHLPPHRFREAAAGLYFRWVCPFFIFRCFVSFSSFRCYVYFFIFSCFVFFFFCSLYCQKCSKFSFIASRLLSVRRKFHCDHSSRLQYFELHTYFDFVEIYVYGPVDNRVANPDPDFFPNPDFHRECESVSGSNSSSCNTGTHPLFKNPF
jgi:hypothetical protein